MRGEMSRRRRRAREGAHPLLRNRARAGANARIARIRAQDASSFRWIRARLDGVTLLDLGQPLDAGHHGVLHFDFRANRHGRKEGA